MLRVVDIPDFYSVFDKFKSAFKRQIILRVQQFFSVMRHIINS